MNSNICKNIKNFPIESASGIMAQYLKIKSDNMDKIVLFRLGEFYETYFEDAASLSQMCEVVLTQRKFKVGNVIMAGIPSSSLYLYISKLIEANKKVAVCEEQKENGKIKGRILARVYTKGNLIDGELIKNSNVNYICSIFQKNEEYGLSFCDISTGEFFLTQGNKAEISSELYKLEPSEILCPVAKREFIPFKIIENPKANLDIDLSDFNTTLVPEDSYEKSSVNIQIIKHPLGLKCANAIINYIKKSYRDFAPKFRDVQPYDIYDYLYINDKAQDKLELTKNQSDGKKQGSLFWVLDKTKTKMGERTLKNWIKYPLKNTELIEKRRSAIKELASNKKQLNTLQKTLLKCYDIKRLWGKLTSKTLNQKDFIALIETLKTIEEITNKKENSLLKFNFETKKELQDLCKFLDNAISHDIEGGSIIKKGVNSKLDLINNRILEIEKSFLEYEKKQKEETKIKSLKLSSNKVLGHYFEISNSNIKNLPKYYKIRQNLSNMSRFTTDEITGLDREIGLLKLKKEVIEEEEFIKIKNYTSEFSSQIDEYGSFLAQIDALQSICTSSIEHNFCVPKISENFKFNIEEGFHPISKKLLGNFTNNDLKIEKDKKFIMLTGPNMAGKSTFLKQNAIIAILNQIGSFVSAKKAELSIFDKIFVRSGLEDELFKSQSTFMSEMLEIKDILEFGTSRSLVLIDELGSGTSTKDGLSLCESICEYIINKINPLTIFATHFHELSDFAKRYSNKVETLMIGRNFDIENGSFERKVEKGFLDKSYGIKVAKIAQLPKEVIEKAEKLLKDDKKI